jgi:hypothetical protein
VIIAPEQSLYHHNENRCWTHQEIEEKSRNLDLLLCIERPEALGKGDELYNGFLTDVTELFCSTGWRPAGSREC